MKEKRTNEIRSGRDPVQSRADRAKTGQGAGFRPQCPCFPPLLPLKVAALGAASGSRRAPFLVLSPCRLFVGAGLWLASLLGGRIRMLLDKNPHAGFLSPHAPAGAARPRGGLSRFPRPAPPEL